MKKRVLIIKMSSMGDVIHTLPALTDAQQAFPHMVFDWVVEPGFAEIPRWHKAVEEVIPVSLRKWRKHPWQAFKQGEWQAFIKKLRHVTYDAVIDAQGLVKSALVTRLAKGPRFGLNRQSARESMASMLYQQKVDVVFAQHAVVRMRQIFSQALGYPYPLALPDYGIDRTRLASTTFGENTILFLHGTTWPTKHWPVSYWQQLGRLAIQAGFDVLLPWGNETERLRAEHIKDFSQSARIRVLPKLSLGEITSLISRAKGIVAVDTGLGHVCAAMAAPTVSLYGPTNPDLTGAYGPNQHHLRANFPCAPCLSRDCLQGQDFAIMPPCFETIPPEKVWHQLLNSMKEYESNQANIMG